MIVYKTRDEIELIKESSLLVSKTLGEINKIIEPGITPLELDKFAETFIRDHKATPGFLGLYGFPNTLCVSVNEQVVHGIPTNSPLKNGDIVSVDCGVKKNNYFGDHAYTFEVGEVSKEIKKLLKVTKESLYLGIKELKVGNKIGDVSNKIQNYTESFGYGVVRELVGHGIGTNLHEDPQVPNYGDPGMGVELKEGMCLAIEPMINIGDKEVYTLDDGWTVKTKDGYNSAHFEHTIAILKNGPKVLSGSRLNG